MLRLACVLVVLGATAHADPRRWPKDGVCVPALEKRPCTRLRASDAAKIQDALLVYLSPARLRDQPGLGRARELAALPIDGERIGRFHLVSTFLDARTAPAREVLQLSAGDWSNHRGFTADVTRTKAGWTVLRVTQYSRHPIRRR